jgi:hypothetical protein
MCILTAVIRPGIYLCTMGVMLSFAPKVLRGLERFCVERTRYVYNVTMLDLMFCYSSSRCREGSMSALGCLCSLAQTPDSMILAR